MENDVGDGKLERFAARDGISLGAPASISDLSRLAPQTLLLPFSAQRSPHFTVPEAIIY